MDLKSRKSSKIAARAQSTDAADESLQELRESVRVGERVKDAGVSRRALTLTQKQDDLGAGHFAARPDWGLFVVNRESSLPCRTR